MPKYNITGHPRNVHNLDQPNSAAHPCTGPINIIVRNRSSNNPSRNATSAMNASPSNVVESDGVAMTASRIGPVPIKLKFQPTARLRPLKEEVLELIEPWRDEADNPPPFTAGELIVMTLVLNDLPALQRKEIHAEILAAFQYYGVAAMVEYSIILDAQLNSPTAPIGVRLEDVVDGFQTAMKDFELPLTSVVGTGDEAGMDLYTTTSGAARVYLRDRLSPPRQGTFNFMGLPTEIREKILKMLLVFPKPALTVGNRDTSGSRTESLKLGLLSREDKVEPAYGTMLTAQHHQIAVEPHKKTLALLGVSHQMRDEALPVFYRQNNFRFGSLDHLRKAIKNMTFETIEQIQDIRVVMSDHCSSRRSLPGYRQLSPKNLILLVPLYTSFGYFCSGSDEWDSTTPSETQLEKLNSLAELWDIVAVAKRAKHLSIQGAGFLGGWLREKIDSNDEMPKFTEDDNRNH